MTDLTPHLRHVVRRIYNTAYNEPLRGPVPSALVGLEASVVALDALRVAATTLRKAARSSGAMS
jgi:hypothetical protein